MCEKHNLKVLEENIIQYLYNHRVRKGILNKILKNKNIYWLYYIK